MNADTSVLPARGGARRAERPSNVLSAADTSILRRAFLILAQFRNEPVLGVSELARRTGLPRTTVHRLANQLHNEGALGRVGTKFRVGATLFELGSLHFPLRLRDILQPVIDDLHRVTRCDVSLLELVGGDAVVVAASQGNMSAGGLGRRLPASACAGGQILLAFDGRYTDDRLRALCPSNTDHRRLVRRLAGIRGSGAAVEHGDTEPGRSSIGVTVVNRHGRVLAGLMLSGPTVGFDVDALTNTASAFSRTLTAAGQKAAIGFFASARPRSDSAKAQYLNPALEPRT